MTEVAEESMVDNGLSSSNRNVIGFFLLLLQLLFMELVFFDVPKF